MARRCERIVVPSEASLAVLARSTLPWVDPRAQWCGTVGTVGIQLPDWLRSTFPEAPFIGLPNSLRLGSLLAGLDGLMTRVPFRISGAVVAACFILPLLPDILRGLRNVLRAWRGRSRIVLCSERATSRRKQAFQDVASLVTHVLSHWSRGTRLRLPSTTGSHSQKHESEAISSLLDFQQWLSSRAIRTAVYWASWTLDARRSVEDTTNKRPK